jgi:methyl-accepting chemotaxis protein
MKNMGIKTKLIGGFSLVALITLVVGIVGWTGISSTDEALREVAIVRVPSIEGLQIMNEAQTAISRFERILVYEKNPEHVARNSAGLVEAWKRAEKGWKIYEPLPQTKEEEIMWKEFMPKWETWKKAHQEVIELVKKGDHEKAYALTYGKAREAFGPAEKLLNDLIALNVNVADEFTKKALPAAERAKLIAVIGMTVGVILSLALGLWLSLSISRPIKHIIDGLEDGSDQVASASGQVSSASQSLAEGASEQAASIEETSASMEELSSMVRQNSENAAQADALMRDANRVVDQAEESMNQLTRSMEEISTASEETSKIIKTIDEIAFQTNLLALNAAVEAARAGEAGAGFAVVADEVRNLALRAAEAAKNTTNLIEATIKNIKDGGMMVTKTSQDFSEVARSTSKVGELVAEISAASKEQAQGIDQINKAVSEMDKVVQQNAASAEENASASEEMNSQSEQMKNFVGELVMVVSGNGNRDKHQRAKALPTENGIGRQVRAGYHLKADLPKTLAKPTIIKKERRLTVTGYKELNPEQLISFDDGESEKF